MNREIAKEFLDDKTISIDQLIGALLEHGKKYVLKAGEGADLKTYAGRVVILGSQQVTIENDKEERTTLRLHTIRYLTEE